MRGFVLAGDVQRHADASQQALCAHFLELLDGVKLLLERVQHERYEVLEVFVDPDDFFGLRVIGLVQVAGDRRGRLVDGRTREVDVCVRNVETEVQLLEELFDRFQGSVYSVVEQLRRVSVFEVLQVLFVLFQLGSVLDVDDLVLPVLQVLLRHVYLRQQLLRHQVAAVEKLAQHAPHVLVQHRQVFDRRAAQTQFLDAIRIGRLFDVDVAQRRVALLPVVED